MANKNKKNKRNFRRGNRNNNRRNNNRPSKNEKMDAQSNTSPESTGGTDEAGSNDIGWHIANPNLLTGIKEFNFFNPVGRSFETMNPDANNGTVEGTVPSICRYDFVPTPGMCRDETTAASQIAARMENMMARFSGRNNSSYDSNDIFMMLFACANVYMAMNETKRIFRTISSWNYFNEYIPEVLAESMYVDLDDWKNHLADIPAQFNELLRRIEYFALPEGLPFLYKWLQLTDVVYKDQDNTYGQYFYYSPTCFYQWRDYIPDDPDEAPRSQCIPIPKRYSKVVGSSGNPVYSTKPVGQTAEFIAKNHPFTWNEWKLMLEGMIRSIQNSSSFKKIFDDFLRVYGDTPKLILAPLDLFETLTFTVDPNINLIVKGMVITPEAKLMDSTQGTLTTHGPWFPVLDQVVDMNTNRLEFNYYFPCVTTATGGSGFVKDFYLTRRPVNALVDAPPTEVMFYLLLESPTYMPANGFGQAYMLQVESCTTELVTGATIYQIVYDSSTGAKSVFNGTISSNALTRTMVGGVAYWDDMTLWKLWAMNSYSVHPMLVSGTDTMIPTTQSAVPLTHFFEDINHIVYIDQERIKGFHDVDLISLFRCPGWNYDVGGGGAAVNSMAAGKK